MPDIDIDFDNMRREEVIDYVSNKYGKYNTARIISFNTMLPKQIIRDTARVMNIDIRAVDNICKTIKDEKTMIGHTTNYLHVIMPLDSTKIGKDVEVTLETTDGEYFYAKLNN